MIAFHKGEIPFTLLLIPFIMGLSVDAFFACSSYTILLKVIFGGLFIAFVALNFGYKSFNLYKVQWVGGLIISLLIFVGGILCLESSRQIYSPQHFSKFKPAYLIGRINSEPKLNAGILRFITKVEQGGDTIKATPMLGNLMVSVKIDTAKKIVLNYGDRLIFPANFTPVDAPMNPAEFNYKAYLANQNIYHQSFLIQHQVSVLQHGQGNSFVAYALNLRLNLVNKLKSVIRDTDAVAVASTIILGYRTDLRKEVQEAYAKTGTMHLLSVAGMHVGLVFIFITFFLSFLPHGKHYRIIKTLVSITLIWCYALITGFSPPVTRAVLMLTMVLIGSNFNRHINRLNVLAVSAFVLLLYNPFYITDAGFQLSYLAVFGIIILQPYIYKWARFKGWLANHVWQVVCVSLAAQIILLPIGALYFHDFPVYFLVSNVFIIVPSMIVMYVGLCFLLLPHIPVISPLMGQVLERTVTIMTKTLSMIEHAPLGNIDKIWLSPTEFLLLYGIIISLFFFLIKRSKQWLKVSLVIGLFISVSLSVEAYRSSNTSSMMFFSMRKNSGILFRNGKSAILLTDLKPQDKAYQYTIQPYLDSCKIERVDTLTKQINNGYLIKQGNLIQFADKKILLFDRSMEGKIFSDKLNIDYLYITGNPHTNLEYLLRSYNFKQLIADGTNSTRNMDQLEKEAMFRKINFINLKRNKSLLLVSK